MPVISDPVCHPTVGLRTLPLSFPPLLSPSLVSRPYGVDGSSRWGGNGASPERFASDPGATAVFSSSRGLAEIGKRGLSSDLGLGLGLSSFRITVAREPRPLERITNGTNRLSNDLRRSLLLEPVRRAKRSNGISPHSCQTRSDTVIGSDRNRKLHPQRNGRAG